MRRVYSRLLAIVLTSFVWSCSEKVERPAIGQNLARPISITTDAKGEFFYILNSDLKHSYASGSILIMDRAGERKVAYRVPRLGRHIFLKGNDLLVTFDRNVGKKAYSIVYLYNVVRDGDNMPRLEQKQAWGLTECNPINGIIEGNYIAIACQTGRLFLGTLAEDRTKSTLDPVRLYPSFVRRAIYIDAPNDLLYAFVTDWGEPNLRDQLYTDSQSLDETTGEMRSGAPNDVPDELEKTKLARQKLATQGSAFQFAVMDLRQAKEEADANEGHFKFHSYDKVAKKEMRWIYFNLEHTDQTKDIDLKPEQKYYRTNFWSARKDENDNKAFYLSHRGYGDEERSKHANNIVKVAIKGTREEILDFTKPTSSVFEFSRVFGHADTLQVDGERYLADFAVTRHRNQPAVFVSSFRSLANFPRERYGLWAAPMETSKVKDFTKAIFADEDPDRSFFSIAVGSDFAGDKTRIFATSFYGDSVYLFDVEEDFSLTEIKHIP